MQYLVKRVRLKDSNNGTVARHIRDRLGREGMAPVEAERRAVACDRDRGGDEGGHGINTGWTQGLCGCKITKYLGNAFVFLNKNHTFVRKIDM